MAINLVGSEWTVAATVNAATIALPAQTVTTGSLVVVAVSVRGGVVPTALAASDGTNTYSVFNTVSTANCISSLLYAFNVTGGAITITLSKTGGSANVGWVASAWEFAGALTTDPKDVSATNFSASSTSISTTTAATNFANELVFAMYGNGGNASTTYSAQTFTPSTTPTIGATLNATGASTINLNCAWEIEGASTGTQKYQATTSTNGQPTNIVGTFQAAPVTIPLGGGTANVAGDNMGNSGGNSGDSQGSS